MGCERVVDIIQKYWNRRRFNHGMTKVEIDKLLKELGIDRKKYNKAFGVNTCAIDEGTGEILYYHCDIESAIICVLENRDKTLAEWD